MSDEGSLVGLLALGPASGIGLYWMLYRYYRNTDKSHAFERETRVVAKPATGSDEKVGTNNGTQEAKIRGNNVRNYRERVRRTGNDAQRTVNEAGAVMGPWTAPRDD